MKSSLEVMAGGGGGRAERPARTARRTLAELAPYGRRLLYIMALVLVAAGAQASAPWLISRAIDRQILGGDRAGLSRSMLILLALYVVAALVSRAQVYEVGAVGQRVLASLRLRLFRQFQRLPLRFFDRRPIGDLMSRAVSDVETLNQLLSQGL